MNGVTIILVGIAAIALVIGGCVIWHKHGKKIETDIKIITDAGKKLKG